MKPIIRNTDTAIIAPPARRDYAVTAQQAKNDRRLGDYYARRQGIQEPKLKLWRA